MNADRREVHHALLVDLYELTMANAYRREAMVDQTATFSLFVRTLPPGRGFLVSAGLDDALSWLEDLSFADDELAAVERLALFDSDFLDWLAELHFTGRVRAVPEGTLVFAHEPILEVDAPLGQAQLAETFLLNQITLQTMLATKAARCRQAAGGRAVVDFALRRTQGIDAGMKLARVCRLTGLAATSNVAGADRYGLPASGTMAHSFIQAHRDEAEAFRAYARASGPAAVLLVDTYDTRRGVDRAIQVAIELREQGGGISGIRLDSGDLGHLARYARARLDEAGLGQVRILASGGLDEHEIHRLVQVENAPIDGFGVGSALGVSADAPSLDSVYKLVAHDGRPVLKTSPGKAIWPGAKQVWRSSDWSADTLALAEELAPGATDLPLLVEVMDQGERTSAGRCSLSEANEHFEHQWASLPEALSHLSPSTSHPVEISPRLRQLADDLRIEHQGKDGA
ncbi:MAG: nicotinate phosphoribosyltransferase [Actinomycetota bacterium]|nr:nicotinate phosphoribosyltransferase [Actinomycetota bacterium]